MSSPVLIEQLDCAIDVLLTDPDVAITNVDPAVAELLAVAAELRTLPRPDFRSQLKTNLIQGTLVAAKPREAHASAVSSASRQLVRIQRKADEDILPTLFGRGYGTYAVRRSNFALSLAAHAVALALIVATSVWMMRHPVAKGVQLLRETIPLVSEYVPLTKTSQPAQGGGGGGDRDKMLASQGHLPKAALEQVTPPEVVVRNVDPKLPVEPT